MNITEYIALGIVGILSLVQISPLKIDPWGVLFQCIGKWMNKDVNDKLDNLKKRIDEHIKTDEEETVKRTRTRLLRFNDEILHGVHHTQEHFDEILEDIDTYERYCNEHTNYPNSKAVMSIENIKKTYRYCFENKCFAVPLENDKGERT